MIRPINKKMMGLYIHIPFCEKKCLYCSFVVSIGQQARIDAYLNGLEQEAKHYAGANVGSVYMGGGTPTFMSAAQIEKLLLMVKRHFDIHADAEWTMEANPEGLDQDKLTMMHKLGVNRISLGVQSLNEKYLKYLGRVHDNKTALTAFERIRAAGFKNINVDLMLSFPSQTIDELREDIEAMTAFKSDHISAYSLMVEPHSRFYAQKICVPDSEKQKEQYLLLLSMLETSGFMQYEVSNFAQPNKESSHNINYWSAGNYIGLGIGAHSHLDGRRFWNVNKLLDYIKRIEGGQSVIEGEEALGSYHRFLEAFIFGLRMNAGISIQNLEERFGERLDSERQSIIDECLRGGLLFLDQGRIKARLRGRLVLDEIAAKII